MILKVLVYQVLDFVSLRCHIYHFIFKLIPVCPSSKIVNVMLIKPAIGVYFTFRNFWLMWTYQSHQSFVSFYYMNNILTAIDLFIILLVFQL